MLTGRWKRVYRINSDVENSPIHWPAGALPEAQNFEKYLSQNLMFGRNECLHFPPVRNLYCMFSQQHV